MAKKKKFEVVLMFKFPNVKADSERHAYDRVVNGLFGTDFDDQEPIDLSVEDEEFGLSLFDSTVKVEAL